MSLRAALVLVAALAATLLGGCVSTADRQQAFAPVQADVAGLSGDRVVWNRDVDTEKLVTDDTWQRLKTPLDASAAAQIALLNSPDLQATFEEIGISQENFATKPFDEKGARQNLAATQARVTHRVIEFIAEVKAAFYTYQADLQLEDWLKLMIQAGAQKEQQVGNINQLASLNAQMAMADTQKETIAAREKLNRLMGLRLAAIAWTAKPELPPLPARDPGTADLEFIALDQRRDLQALRKEAGAASHPGHGQGQNFTARDRQLRHRLQSLLVEIGSEVREASRTLFLDRQQVELLRNTVVPLGAKVADQAQEPSNAEQANAGGLVLADRGELEAERDYIGAWRDYWIARAQLEAAVGGNLSGHSSRP